MSPQTPLIALMHGPDRPGIVAGVSRWLYDHGCNILNANQHKDSEESIFFQRLEWSSSAHTAKERDAFIAFVSDDLGMTANVACAEIRPKVALFVSKFDHCFHDTILRFKSGEMDGDLVCIVSNHDTLEQEALQYGIPFHYVPVTKQIKAQAETEQLSLLKQYGVSLVVMARYMQVLSSEFLSRVGCPVINIHHSFLPAFAGGRPYHQAFKRGVKLIGATAHYATADLDEGPIIHQDVTRISHRNMVSDLIRKGRDLEKSVFAEAIRLHLAHRILVYKNKTVVFD